MIDNENHSTKSPKLGTSAEKKSRGFPSESLSRNGHKNKIQKGKTATKYDLSRDLYLTVRDTVAAAFVLDRHGNLSPSRSSLLLRTAFEGGAEFVDSVVEHLAKDMEGHLISVDLCDLIDLGWEFCNQDESRAEKNDARTDISSKDEATREKSTVYLREEEDFIENHSYKGSPIQYGSATIDTSPGDESNALEASAVTEQPDDQTPFGFAEFYFASRSKNSPLRESHARNEESLAALLNGPIIKAQNHQFSDLDNMQEQDASPIFLHVHDGNRLVSEAPLFLGRFLQGVQEHRKTLKEVVLIVSISKEKAPSYYSFTSDAGEDLLRDMRVDAASIIDISPLISNRVATNGQEIESERTKRTNIRLLKAWLRYSVPRQISLSKLLSPFFSWESTEKGEDLSFLGCSLLPQEALKRATTQIVGTTRGKSSLALEAVFAVLRRLRPKSDVIPAEDDDRFTSETNFNKSNNPSGWGKKLERIKADCSEIERELLLGLVKPGIYIHLYPDFLEIC